MSLIQYDSWLEVSASRKLAKELRDSGKYNQVTIGSYLKENGKFYSKVYVTLENKKKVIR